MKSLVLRETKDSDVATIVGWEQHPDNASFILPWDEDRHLAALRDPDCRYFTLEDGARAVGFVLLAGLSGENEAVEFRRIVVADKGRGYGRAAVEAVKRYCFEEIGKHRLWLDVFEENARARRLYESTGFRYEGTLRDCVKVPGGFRSLVVMSILSPEYP